MRISYDRQHVPGIWAQDREQVWWGLGWVHGRHRPQQSLILHAASRGRLCDALAPLSPLAYIDEVSLRWDLVSRAQAACARLDSKTQQALQCYLRGFERGCRRADRSFLGALLRLPPPDVSSLLSSTMLVAFLGLSEGQERMERALISAMHHGADPEWLSRAFSPHTSVDALMGLKQISPSEGLDRQRGSGWRASTGSNAWAVSGQRSASGSAMLAGDPHLQVNLLPAIFCEVRASMGDQWLMGATIPGLPGFAVGRNKHFAWSGTYAVHDNIDGWHGDAATEDSATRVMRHRRRGWFDRRLSYVDSPYGVSAEPSKPKKKGTATTWAWSGREHVDEAMTAYLDLPFCESVTAADRVLGKAQALSLHFVLADRAGAVGHVQAGSTPLRSDGSGLVVRSKDDPPWQGIRWSEELPRRLGADWVASANEPSQMPDGWPLSTLAQPLDRHARIAQTIEGRDDWDVEGFKKMQLDVFSSRAETWAQRFCALAPGSPAAKYLVDWGGRFEAGPGAPRVFEHVYRHLLGLLSTWLGGDWFVWALEHTELSVWWRAALDRLLDDDQVWSQLSDEMTQWLKAGHGVDDVAPLEFSLAHMVLGSRKAPKIKLAGSIYSLRQGNILKINEQSVAVAPAYRFVCDLGEDAAYSSLPGGLDESPRSSVYAHRLEAWDDGDYHRLVPPQDDERWVDAD